MRRAIYEDDVIKLLDKGWKSGVYPVASNIHALPSAQPEPQWIPCSERLPEESDGTVLVCFPDEFPYSNKEPYINAKHNQRVKTAYYSQFNKTWYIGDFGAIGEVRPIAWLPLPEPYAERRES